MLYGDGKSLFVPGDKKRQRTELELLVLDEIDPAAMFRRPGDAPSSKFHI
jgi:hypothetical protein